MAGVRVLSNSPDPFTPYPRTLCCYYITYFSMRLTLVILLVALFSNFSYSATITSKTTGGNWSTGSTWNGNSVPAAGDDVVINGNVSIGSNVSCKSLTINSGKTLSFNTGGYILTISNSWSAALTNNGTFTAGDGTVTFTGSGGEVVGTVIFNNAVVNGAQQFKFSATSTINNTLRATNGGFLSSFPIYGSSAVLEIAGNYTLNNNYYLWPNSTGSTMPPNITIVSGTLTSSQLGIFIKRRITVLSGATWNAQTTCFTLGSTFTGISNSGTLNLGGVSLVSGATWNLDANYTINNLNIPSGAVVNCNSYILTVAFNNNGGTCGNSNLINLSSGGTFNTGTGTVILDPDGNQALSGALVFNNLIVRDGTVVLNNTGGTSVAVNGNIAVNTGGNFNYGNSIPTGTLVLTETSTVTNGGGNTANITNPNNNTVNIDNAITTLATSSAGGGSFNSARQLNAPDVYTLTADMTFTGSRKALIINPGSTFRTNGFKVNVDTIYVYGILDVANATGISGMLGTNARIIVGSTSSIRYSGGAQNIDAGYAYNNLEIGGTGTKTLQSGNYTISGNFTRTGGTISLNAGSVFTFNGNKNQSVLGLAYNNPTFSGSGTKTLTDTAKVTGVVNVSGTAVLASNGLLTLTSTASGTASIGTLNSATAITGKINYERYIPAGRLWRFIGWPITGTKFAQAWQQYIYLTGPGTGGGSLGTVNSNGYDWTQSNEPGLYYYNESSSAAMNSKWTVIPNTSGTISTSLGYRVFVRGARSQGTSLLNGSNYTPLPVVLKGTGDPQMGNVTVSLTCSNGCTTGNGWHLLSNPYPSAIDWNNATWRSERNANIQSTVYIYNPAQNKYGAWSPTGGAVNGGSSIIASGQAFYIKTNGATSLTFKEAFKVANATAGLFGKNEGEPGTRNNLKVKIGDANKVFDETVVYMYNGATQGVDEELDALKPDAGNASISTHHSIDNAKLIFNAIPELFDGASDTVLIHMPLANASYEYQLSFEGISSFENTSTQFILLDGFTGNQIILSEDSPVYPFSTISGNALSYHSARFKLLITTETGSSLPVKLSSFAALAGKDANMINWTTSSEENNALFVIERSYDGAIFEPIGEVAGAGNSNRIRHYQLADRTFKGDVQYYRLKQVDFSGAFSYSPVAVVSRKAAPSSHISAFPIPAEDVLNLNLNNANPTSAHIRIIDLMGKVIWQTEVDADEPNYLIPIDVSSLHTGMYAIEAQIDGKRETIKFNKK